MRRILYDPRLHFLLIGVAMFAAHAWISQSGRVGGGARELRLTHGDVAWIKKTWSQQRQREPDEEELRGLVADYIKEMLLADEARELGLGENDPYIRRRLAQKMEFLVQDASRVAEPTHAELRAFYAANRERFLSDALVSFEHVYFSSDHSTQVARALDRLQAGADPMTVGDRISLEPRFDGASAQAVAAQFGDTFAEAIFSLETGVWTGPVESGYGVHLVRVTAKTVAEPRPFDEVEARVADLWRDQRQREDNAKYLADLRRRYVIVADEGLDAFVAELEPRP